MTNSYHIPYMAKVWAKKCSKQKDSKILTQKLTKNALPKLWSGQYFYFQFYINFTQWAISKFECGDILVMGYFRNAKTYECIQRQLVVRALPFYINHINMSWVSHRDWKSYTILVVQDQTGTEWQHSHIIHSKRLASGIKVFYM